MIHTTRRTALAGALAAAILPATVRATPRPARPLVLGHRGAPAHCPEHTLASYARAIADGADFVEPDLVPTRDGVLIARHENNIAGTTDVSTRPEFAARRTTKVVDGQKQDGWFTEDFTLAEIKTLRAKERLGALRPESQAHDSEFQVVSLEEIADFVAAEAAARGRTIGLIPEIKHSTYFNRLGFRVEDLFVARLEASRYLRTAPVIVQSFETGNLKLLRSRLKSQANVQLMQLADDPNMQPADWAAAGDKRKYADMLAPAGLAEVARYADWIAPGSRSLIAESPDGTLAAPGPVFAAAHRLGLLVGTYTFRPENQFLPRALRDGAGPGARNPAGSIAEIRVYLAAGLDGFFTDDPAIGRKAVDG